MTTKLAELAHFGNYEPDTFGWPHAVPDLVPLTFNGVNFGHCARDAHDLFVAFLTELVPHIQGGLKAGSCWAYSDTDDLPDGSWSFHRYGLAIDINWNVNHMGNDIPDAHGKWAMPRQTVTALALKYGLEWGGNWSGGYHDNMHVEVHLSPGDARNFRKHLPSTVRKIITPRSGFPYVGPQYFGPINGPARSHGGATKLELAYVRIIQLELARLGYAGPNWKPGSPWGPATTAAVKRWQADTHQKQTGVLTASGWKRITS